MRRKQRFIIIHVFFVRESSLCACFFTFLTRRKPIPSTFSYEIIKRKFLPKFLNIFPFVAVFLCPHNNFLTVLKTTRELFYPLCYEGVGEEVVRWYFQYILLLLLFKNLSTILSIQVYWDFSFESGTTDCKQLFYHECWLGVM